MGAADEQLDLRSCTETTWGPRCSRVAQVLLAEQVYVVLSSDQLENDCNVVIKTRNK